MKSKICGIKNKEILKYIISHTYPPEFIGFICNYRKSKRFVSIKKLKKLVNIKKRKSKYVAVLVKPNKKNLQDISNLPFDYYQIYDQTAEELKVIKKKYKKKIIVAITIEKKNDIKKYKEFKNVANIFLFDSKGYEKSLSFNHSYLKNLPKNMNKMIAGNIQTKKIYKIKNNEFIVDVSGSLESKEGIKDINKIDKFLNTVHNINS